MEEKRPQEIDDNSFHEETVSSERTGRPLVETSVRLKRHMKERGDSLLKQTQKMCQMVAKHVLFHEKGNIQRWRQNTS